MYNLIQDDVHMKRILFPERARNSVHDSSSRQNLVFAVNYEFDERD